MHGRISLNRLFPATKVARFESLPGEGHRFSLHVHYARTPRARPKVFESTLELSVEGNEVTGLIEHWHWPLERRGDGSKTVSRLVRSTLGRLLA